MPTKPNKKAVPVPDIQVYARPRGNIMWQCPNCANMHSKANNLVLRRRAQLKCHDCGWRYRFGVGFTQIEGTFRAYNLGYWQGNLANRLNLRVPDGMRANGFLYGPIDWACPHCNRTQESKIVRREGTVKCVCCAQVYFVQLLLYRPSGSKTLCPYDWAVYIDAPTAENSIPPETPNTCGGITGEITSPNCGDPLS